MEVIKVELAMIIFIKKKKMVPQIDKVFKVANENTYITQNLKSISRPTYYCQILFQTFY